MAGDRPKVLIVDDEPDICELLHDFLSDQFAITTFSDPFVALEHFKDNQFDLVVTDLKMPKISGADLVKKMREIRIDIPIVVITGHSDEKEMESALFSGLDGVITKPFDGVDEVAKVLWGCLRKEED